MTKPRLYIAYGSNLNLRQMASRCPTATVVGTATLNNWRLCFRGGRGSAVATVERRKGGSVPVLVWTLQPKDEAALDAYEGWPRLYRKETLRIRLNGKPVFAMIYLMNHGYPLGSPSYFYLNTILEGYHSAGFDVGSLLEAVRQSGEKDNM